MKIRTKIFLAFFLIAALGLYFMMKWVKDDVRARYLESVEETMVDMANTLAILSANNIKDGKINTSDFDSLFKSLENLSFEAKIYEITKTTVDTHVYITDEKGIVIFDSGKKENNGKDYSRWNNIYRTLRKRYGARATRLDKDTPESLVMHITAPITVNDEIVGTLTVYKSISFLSRFIHQAEDRIMMNAILAFSLVVLLGVVVSIWLTRPILKLKSYVDAIKVGKKVELPNVGKGEVGALTTSFEELREALEGKKYVEEYVRNLTHELKSPISGIQGSLELLSEENCPPEQREKFLRNMLRDNLRMRQIVDRMLLLSQLENVNSINSKTDVDIIGILKEIIESAKTSFPSRNLEIKTTETQAIIKGDSALIYDAFDNIIKNAVDFTLNNGSIDVSLKKSSSEIIVTISDDGAGIPDFAQDKIFDKFYSLPRPGKEEKSSGLGLSITKEIIELHGGKIKVAKRPEKGTIVSCAFKL